MINTAVVFDHRGRTQKGKEGPLEVRVTIERRPYYINTGVRVRKEEWKLGTIVNRVDAPELNERLALMVRRVEAEINACIKENRPIDVAEIRRRLTEVGVRAEDDAFLKWAENEAKTMNLSQGTKSHYATLIMRLYEWGKIKSWGDVTVANILEWDKWLHQLTKPQTNAQKLAKVPAEHLTDGAVFSYHKNLKKLLNLAVKIGVLEQNPYVRLKGEFARGDRPRVDYLTIEEMKKIQTAELAEGSHLCMIRDLFVVQMYTGMAYADLMAFSINDYKEVNGKWIAVSERVKTGTAYIGQLMKPVVEVLKRYDWQLPHITNQKYNEGLKELAKALELDTRLYSHLGRHTFATFMLSKGVKIENVSKMLGHTNITQTQRYAKVLAKDVRDDFDKIDAEL